MLAMGVRLPGYSLPKVLERELNPPQMEVNKKWKKKEEELSTTLKRYRETNHITVLNLKNPTSWRGYRKPLHWMEDFRTEGNKMGNLNNMHQLCVPKGKQLDHFV